MLAVLLTSYPGKSSGNEGPAYHPAPPRPGYADITALPYREPDHVIAYGEHTDQYGLLWLARAPEADAKPTLVLIHGGCWLNAYDISHTRALATALSQAGYPVWSLEYRRADETASAWPDSLDDLQQALSHRQTLAQYGAATGQLILLGHSAGGHLALLLAASLEAAMPRAVSVVGLAAITDIVRYAAGDNSCQRAVKVFMGGDPQSLPQAYAAANPVALELRLPLTLLHGDRDEIVPLTQAQRLHGDNVTRVVQPGAGHFDWIHPGTPAFQVLLQTLERLYYPD